MLKVVQEWVEAIIQSPGITEMPRSIVEELRTKKGASRVFAQICTGRGKVPTIFYSKFVAKGPYNEPSPKVSCILENQRSLAHFSLSRGRYSHMPVRIFRNPEDGKLYSVSPNFGGIPTDVKWGMVHKWSNLEGYILKRSANSKVCRLNDYLDTHGNIPLKAWEQVYQHLIDRFLLDIGDTGFWNFLIVEGQIFGIDMEEKRNAVRLDKATDMDTMMFSRDYGIKASNAENAYKAFLQVFFNLEVAIKDGRGAALARSKQAESCLNRSFFEWTLRRKELQLPAGAVVDLHTSVGRKRKATAFMFRKDGSWCTPFPFEPSPGYPYSMYNLHLNYGTKLGPNPPPSEPMEWPTKQPEKQEGIVQLRELDLFVGYRVTVMGGMDLDIWKSVLQKGVRRKELNDALLALAHILSLGEAVTIVPSESCRIQQEGENCVTAGCSHCIAILCSQALPKITNLFHRFATILLEDVARNTDKFVDILKTLKECHEQKDLWKEKGGGLPIEEYKRSVETVFVRLSRALKWMCGAPKCRSASVINALFPYDGLQAASLPVPKHPDQDRLISDLENFMAELSEKPENTAIRRKILEVWKDIMRLYPKKRLGNGKWSFHPFSTHGAIKSAVEVVKPYCKAPGLIDLLFNKPYLKRTFAGMMDQYLYHWTILLFCIAGDEMDPFK